MDVMERRGYLVLEMAEGGSLLDYMQERHPYGGQSNNEDEFGRRKRPKNAKKEKRKEEEAELSNNNKRLNLARYFRLVVKAMMDVARGMQYLHQCGVWHRDLVVENILVFPPKDGDDEALPTFKVSDLGLAHVRTFLLYLFSSFVSHFSRLSSSFFSFSRSLSFLLPLSLSRSSPPLSLTLACYLILIPSLYLSPPLSSISHSRSLTQSYITLVLTPFLSRSLLSFAYLSLAPYLTPRLAVLFFI